MFRGIWESGEMDSIGKGIEHRLYAHNLAKRSFYANLQPSLTQYANQRKQTWHHAGVIFSSAVDHTHTRAQLAYGEEATAVQRFALGCNI